MTGTGMRVFVEGYGCSANLAETEQIKGFFHGERAVLVEKPELADVVIVNSCGVKKSTGFKMKRRVEQLKQLNGSASIVVAGCLPKINPGLLANQDRVVQTGPDLKEVARAAGVAPASFSPVIEEVRFNPRVSMIPIAKGCLSNCSFCGTKKARGVLQSHSVASIAERFVRDLKNGTREFWLASQDNGCFGFDQKTNLPRLLETLLSNDGNFRIRVGMLSPQYLERYYDEFVSVFSDERLYKFLHLPLQSGNNRVLGLMKRQYSIEQFEQWVSDLRRDIPVLSIATDMIVGFPTETSNEFSDSVQAVKRVQPDVVNISRFSLHPETAAEQLPQTDDREKNRRSQELTRVCRNLFLEKNKKLVGKKEPVMICEKKSNGLVARTNSYRPVFVPQGPLGEFASVEITEAFPLFLKGRVL